MQLQAVPCGASVTLAATLPSWVAGQLQLQEVCCVAYPTVVAAWDLPQKQSEGEADGAGPLV